MGSLFAELARQAPANARREIDAYARDVPEFAAVERDTRARAEALDYAVWFRRRTIELSPQNGVLTDGDLDYIASMGELRANAGMSLASRQQVLSIHTELMLREIDEATRARSAGSLDELMRVMGWFAPQGERGIDAYCRGFVTVLRRRMPFAAQAALLAKALLSDDPMAKELARVVDVELADTYAVVVIRVPDRPGDDRDLDDVVEALVRAHRTPAFWNADHTGRGGELIALLPDGPHLPDVAGDFAASLGHPCAAGTATGPRTDLADALDRARRISRTAPLHRAPARVRPRSLADVFVELAVADAPFTDAWLKGIARELAPGPDLLLTLDAYYHCDMNRALTATALNVHPRTLDYRLRRVRDLTGLDPASTRGVRILSTVVTRSLSGAWR
ncbi:helix-turn-helix domain-containing protein [Streptomyces roseirectus]|uniref:Helix-turn-helix domain-containing protein n=1 Tax=Streptomyces roseirectus TaxID=2768066 RepID=A0A7H0IRE0_9ACTN|nr:helix-turn-helix domain-containing protein [Streptomyces roseirectus]QNP75356.1 helix-turn-helix domain-containing protein [Streptomyces roseirectus]